MMLGRSAGRTGRGRRSRARPRRWSSRAGSPRLPRLARRERTRRWDCRRTPGPRRRSFGVLQVNVGAAVKLYLQAAGLGRMPWLVLLALGSCLGSAPGVVGEPFEAGRGVRACFGRAPEQFVGCARRPGSSRTSAHQRVTSRGVVGGARAATWLRQLMAMAFRLQFAPYLGTPVPATLDALTTAANTAISTHFPRSPPTTLTSSTSSPPTTTSRNDRCGRRIPPQGTGFPPYPAVQSALLAPGMRGPDAAAPCLRLAGQRVGAVPRGPGRRVAGDDEAGPGDRRADQPQGRRPGAIAEQLLARAQVHREVQQAVLVDEIVLD